MRNFPVKQDSVDFLSASEVNSVFLECETLISSSSLSLSGASTGQLSESIRRHGLSANYFSCTGSANTYSLSPSSSFLAPSALYTGQIAIFYPNVANTGASTVNFCGLGTKSIVQADGSSALSSGMLGTGSWVACMYDGTAFRLIKIGFSAPLSMSGEASASRHYGGVLSLSSDPYSLSDVTSSTLFYSPYIHNFVSLFDGNDWRSVAFSQVSVSVPASTDTVYDVFAYLSSGALAIEFTAWSTATTRATSVERLAGRLVKSSDHTRLLLGTIATSSSSGQASSSSIQRGLSNIYNRRSMYLMASIPDSYWLYTTSTAWRSSNSNETLGQGRVNIVSSLPEYQYQVNFSNAAAPFRTAAPLPKAQVGLGVRSTSSPTISHSAGISELGRGSLNTTVWSTPDTYGYAGQALILKGTLSSLSGLNWIQQIESPDIATTNVSGMGQNGGSLNNLLIYGRW